MLTSDEVEAGSDLRIDRAAWEVQLGGATVELTKTEFLLLLALAERPRQVVTTDELTRIVWGEKWFGDDGNVAVHVSKLRRKLGESGSTPRFIATVRGVGYRFEARHVWSDGSTVAGDGR